MGKMKTKQLTRKARVESSVLDLFDGQMTYLGIAASNRDSDQVVISVGNLERRAQYVMDAGELINLLLDESPAGCLVDR